MKKFLPIIIAVLIVASSGIVWKLTKKEAPVPVITNFVECVAADNPVTPARTTDIVQSGGESYPRQCRSGGKTFTEDIGNELEKANLIRLDSPRPNESIESPLVLSGQARGTWFFEASFPVFLTDWDGRIIGQGIAQAKSEWMTTDFVPFEATLTFNADKNAYSNSGTLILRKDNPSGLPEHDDALEIPVLLAGVVGSAPPPVACTMEAKLCPDGSAVGRTGPNCEFAQCPSAGTNCLKDADCPSSQYMCQETQGTGTACPSSDPSCVPTHTVTAGECKLKAGSACNADADCSAGNLCHKNVCVSPIGSQCSGTADTSCPADFECVQGCGPPVVRYPDDTPPSYFCQLKGYDRPCPICLAKNTLIDTPLGEIPVQDLQIGAPVWTVNASGERVAGVVLETGKTAVPLDHKMVHLVLNNGPALSLSNGRALFVSPGHPTIDGHTIGDLAPGDLYDGARVVSTDRVSYNEGFTYDILPSGETGFYWANKTLLGNTLNL